MKSTEHRRTRHFNILLVVLAIGGLIAILIAVDPMAWASQRSHHSWAGHHGTGGAAMAFCDGRLDDRLGQMGAQLVTWLDLGAGQKASWARFERELGRGIAALRTACGDLQAGDVPATMPERLALMESAITAGAEALRSLRPAFMKFYGTLDEDQRRKIDRFSAPHGFGVR